MGKDLGEAENVRKRLRICRDMHERAQKKLLAVEMSILKQNCSADMDLLKSNIASAMEEAKEARDALRKEQLHVKKEIDKVRQTCQLEPLKQARAAAVAKVKEAKRKLTVFSAEQSGPGAGKKPRFDPTNGGNGTSSSSMDSNID